MRIGLLAAAALLAGTTMVEAHPDFIPGECHVISRHKTGRTLFDVNNAEQLDFLAPLLKIGLTATFCRGDLGPGDAEVLNFLNTGFRCTLGPEAHPIIATESWVEVIKTNGETTLACDFGPRP